MPFCLTRDVDSCDSMQGGDLDVGCKCEVTCWNSSENQCPALRCCHAAPLYLLPYVSNPSRRCWAHMEVLAAPVARLDVLPCHGCPRLLRQHSCNDGLKLPCIAPLFGAREGSHETRSANEIVSVWMCMCSCGMLVTSSPEHATGPCRRCTLSPHACSQYHQACCQ